MDPKLTAPEGRTRTNYRWLICTLLFLATTINYVDRQILSLVKPILDTKLGWSNEEFGLVNSAFQMAYGVGLLAFGWLVDRFGTKIGYTLSIALWSVAAICHSLVNSVAGFRLVRMFLGISEAGNFPAAIKATAQWFPRHERAYATSLFNSGANVGAIVAPATVPLLVGMGGWQTPFIVTGVAGLIWLVGWNWLYSVPEKHPGINREELVHIRGGVEGPVGPGGGVSWIELLKYPQTWSFIVSKFLTDPVWWFFLIWLPDFFHKTRGMDLKKLGPPVVAIYSIVTVLGVAGGWITNYLVRQGWSVNKTRKLCMLFFACCVTPIVFVNGASLTGTVLLIGLAAGAHQAWSANLFTTTSDMFPNRAVASVVGIGGMAGSIGGILFPAYAGWLLDRYKGEQAATGYGILFTICAVAYLLAFLISHVLAPRFEPIALRENLAATVQERL